MDASNLLSACGIEQRDAWKAASAGLATEYAAWPWFQSNPTPLAENLNPTWYNQTASSIPQSVQQASLPEFHASVLATLPEDTGTSPKDAAPTGRSRRFGAHATSTLKQWINTHAAYPYPSEKEEDDLVEDTGLSLKQIRTYLSNARARTRRRQGIVVTPTRPFRITSPLELQVPLPEAFDSKADRFPEINEINEITSKPSQANILSTLPWSSSNITSAPAGCDAFGIALSKDSWHLSNEQAASVAVTPPFSDPVRSSQWPLNQYTLGCLPEATGSAERLSLSSLERYLEEDFDPVTIPAIELAAVFPSVEPPLSAGAASGNSSAFMLAPSIFDSEPGSCTSGSITSGTSHSGASLSSTSIGSGIRKRGRKGKRRYRRTTTPPLPTHAASLGSTLQAQKCGPAYSCTFCRTPCNGKYEWTRHEASHVPNATRWICMPDGMAVQNDSCMFCGEASPSAEHMAKHDMYTCLSAPISLRTFSRKDHLKQHIQRVHRKHQHTASVSNKACHNALLANWFRGADPLATDLNSLWCGFCCAYQSTWKARVDHVAQHFQKGDTVATWRGVQWKCDSLLHSYVLGTSLDNPEYMCALCNRWTGKLGDLKLHEVFAHGILGQEACPTFTHSLEFKDHLLEVHGAVDHDGNPGLDDMIRRCSITRGP